MNNDDLDKISKILEDKLTPIHKELKQHGKILRSLKKDQSTMLKVLDGEQMQQSKRLRRVEEHLGFTPVID